MIPHPMVHSQDLSWLETMKNTRLIIRLIGLGEARAEGLAAAILLTTLAVLAMALVAYTKA
jgi:hypothetical protein